MPNFRPWGRRISRRAWPIPEITDNELDTITVVAVGPGRPSMLTLQAQRELEKADLVVGFKTVLNVVEPWLADAEVRPMTYRDQEEVLEYLKGRVQQGKRCVVGCWGDLNVSASELLARVRRRAGKVKLVPGISSVQVAMARAGIALENAVFITLHKRAEDEDDLEEAVHYLKEGRRHVIMLPRPFDLMPAGIAKSLLDSGIPGDLPVRVYQKLTLDDEVCWGGTLEECGELTGEFSDLSILVFLSGKSPVMEPKS